MKDRTVQYPNRYKLTPVGGTSDTYDLTAVPGTITEPGTVLNKANLLTDATATGLGLTGNPTVNDAFGAVAKKSTLHTATLDKDDWTGSGPYTQTVTVTGIASTDEPIVDVLLSSNNATAVAELEAWAMVSKITTSTNSITAVCLDDKPEVDLNIRLRRVY